MILVVAATERELVGAAPYPAVACGIGPLEAGVRTARALCEVRPAALLHVGIAGARRGAGIALLDCVVGTEARYGDAAFPELAPALRPHPALLEAARRALPAARGLPISTAARVGGAAGAAVEAMEGYAVLRAAELAGVPALEVRVVSNEIEEQDRARWRFDEAFEALAAVTRTLLPALAVALETLTPDRGGSAV